MHLMVVASYYAQASSTFVSFCCYIREHKFIDWWFLLCYLPIVIVNNGELHIAASNAALFCRGKPINNDLPNVSEFCTI